MKTSCLKKKILNPTLKISPDKNMKKPKHASETTRTPKVITVDQDGLQPWKIQRTKNRKTVQREK